MIARASASVVNTYSLRHSSRSGMPDRRVFGLTRASSDLTHHDFAGVHTDSNLNRRASLGMLAVAVAADFVLHPQRRIERALWMVLMCHRRPEQGEDAVVGWIAPRNRHSTASIISLSAGSIIARAFSG